MSLRRRYSATDTHTKTDDSNILKKPKQLAEKTYDQDRILSKLEETKHLLKEIEDDFEDDDFDNLLAKTSPEPAKFVKLTEVQFQKMSEFERINYQLQKNAEQFKKNSQKYDDLNIFVADKEEEERMDAVRNIQEPNMVIQDIMGYNSYFNLLFFKLDEKKLKSILKINSQEKLAFVDLENFLFRKHLPGGSVLYNAYTDDDLKLSFRERKQIYDGFGEWIFDLKNLSANQEKNILLKTVVLIQILFILSNDFFHNNMIYQNCFNECFDINNCFLFIEKEVPLIFQQLVTITNKQLEEFNFFTTFLNPKVVNDYHIQLFLKMEKLPLNIVARFKEHYYYGNDFEKFIHQNILINKLDKKDSEHSTTLLNLEEKNILRFSNDKDLLLKKSLENLKSCQEMEKSDLVKIIRCVRIKNFFLKRRKDDALYKQLNFLISLINGTEVLHFKKLARWIRNQIHNNKFVQNDTNNTNANLTYTQMNKDQRKKEANDGIQDVDNGGDEPIDNSNFYGFSKESLADVYLKRFMEAILVTCNEPNAEQ